MYMELLDRLRVTKPLTSQQLLRIVQALIDNPKTCDSPECNPNPREPPAFTAFREILCGISSSRRFKVLSVAYGCGY